MEWQCSLKGTIGQQRIRTARSREDLTKAAGSPNFPNWEFGKNGSPDWRDLLFELSRHSPIRTCSFSVYSRTCMFVQLARRSVVMHGGVHGYTYVQQRGWRASAGVATPPMEQTAGASSRTCSS